MLVNHPDNGNLLINLDNIKSIRLNVDSNIKIYYIDGSEDYINLFGESRDRKMQWLEDVKELMGYIEIGV